GGPGDGARQEDAEGDDGKHDREDDRGGQAVPGQGAGRVGVEPGQPGGLAGRGVRDRGGDGAGCGQRREDGQAQPDDEPRGLRGTAAYGPGGGERGRGIAVGGPEQDGQQPVQQYRPGSAVDRAGRAGQHSPEALAEPPYGQRPGHRSGQGHLDGRAPGDAEAEQQ